MRHLSPPPLYGRYWERLSEFEPYPAGPGSALAGGRCDYEAGIEHPEPTNLVWLLHGRCEIGGPNQFERWHKDPAPFGLWAPRASLPWYGHEYTIDWGGALAFVPDPYAYPATGRIFAFTGNRTPFFWSYNPAQDEWVAEPGFDDGTVVDDGGALCHGGIWEFDGIAHAVLYAFIGGGSGRFFRYAHPVSPTRGRSRSTGWTELAPVMGGLPVRAGGCLAWCPLPENPDHPMGLVVALRGDYTRGLYFYDPARDEWSAGPRLPNSRQTRGGAAIAAGPNGNEVMLWPGGNRVRDFFRYVYPCDTIEWRNIPPTPMDQEPGSALCQTGGRYFAVFNDSDDPQYPPNTFWRYTHVGVIDPEGAQAAPAATAIEPTTSVRVCRSEHRFSVRCNPGSVGLRIIDAAGAVVTRQAVTAGRDIAELVWRHGTARSGVYLYTIDTPSGSLTGKLLVVR